MPVNWLSKLFFHALLRADPRAPAARLKNDLANGQRAGERIGGNDERNLRLKLDEGRTAVG